MTLHPFLLSFIAAALICLISLSGFIFYFVSAAQLKRILPYVVSLAVGILLGNAFIHLIPHSLEQIHSKELVLSLTIGGMIMFFFLEKGIRGHRHGDFSTQVDGDKLLIKPIGKMNLAGDFIHNFSDGAFIAISFIIDPQLGLGTTIAIVAHEIPQEISDTGTLMYSGYTLRRSLFLNFVSSLSAVLGVIVIMLVRGIVPIPLEYLLPVTAGGFIYIAASGLIPELFKNKTSGRSSIGQGVGIILGILLMVVTAKIETLFAHHQ